MQMRKNQQPWPPFLPCRLLHRLHNMATFACLMKCTKRINVMKILHTSDWHLGQELMSYQRQEQQEAFLDQLLHTAVAECPDAMVVSGDIYHQVAPSARVRQLFLQKVMAIHHALPQMTIVVITGNHDSASQIRVHSPLWREFNVHVVGGIARLDDGSADFDRHIVAIGADPAHPAGYVAAVPFVAAGSYPSPAGGQLDAKDRISRFYADLAATVAKRNSSGAPVVLAGHLTVSGAFDHQLADSVVGGIDSIGQDVLQHGFDYVALGHIHKPSTFGDGRMRYCGSPLACTFDEIGYRHSVSIVSLNGHDLPEIREVEITDTAPLRLFPAEPAEFSKALEKLSELPSGPCHLRLNIASNDGHAPANGEDAVMQRLAELGRSDCRFCQFRITASAGPGKAAALESLTAGEMAETKPIDLIERYFDIRQRPLTHEERQMINTAIELVTENDAK